MDEGPVCLMYLGGGRCKAVEVFQRIWWVIYSRAWSKHNSLLINSICTFIMTSSLVMADLHHFVVIAFVLDFIYDTVCNWYKTLSNQITWLCFCLKVRVTMNVILLKYYSFCYIHRKYLWCYVNKASAAWNAVYTLSIYLQQNDANHASLMMRSFQMCKCD